MHCGLLGRKLGHSYSPQIHKALGSYRYDLFEIEPNRLADFLQNHPFDAINVTIPYKKDVIPFCAELSDRAKQLGAVNTIVRRPDGSLIGHNTDYFGFHSMLQRTGLTVNRKKALVLGSGGASNTVCAVLEELGAEVVIISRSGADNYQNIDRHRDAAIIVNTTPVGMYPDNGRSPVVLESFPALEGVLDLIYNPIRTSLLLQAQQRGLVTENGLWMLVAQAKESAEWFLKKPLQDHLISAIHYGLSQQMQNIILVGMPGSGKSTIGRLVAEATGKTFVDADACIAKEAGMSIPEIFAKSGEQGFRKWETIVLEQLGKGAGTVIATGGGCVTREENLPLLRQNGTVYWIQRDTSLLPTDGRPLSKAGSLENMYQIRKPMYQQFSDYIIANDRSIDTAVKRILALEEML